MANFKLTQTGEQIQADLDLLDKNSMKRAFTIVELVIVIAIIAMLSAILIPPIVNGADSAKEKIIDIYNGQTVRMIDNATGEVLYEGNDSTPPDGYTLVSVSVEDGIVIMYMELQQTSETVSQYVRRIRT